MIASNSHVAKYIVIDLNNEYGGDSICLETNKIIYKLSTNKDSARKIPLKIEDLTEDDFVVLMNASQKLKFLWLKLLFEI